MRTAKQISIEECLKKVSNRFELVRIVARRAKQLTKGNKPIVETKGEKNILISMKEIMSGKVFFIKSNDETDAQ